MNNQQVRFDANQPPPLENYNPYTADKALCEGVRQNGAGWANDRLTEFGRLMGRGETIRLGEMANRNPPVLRTHDRYGERLDVVDFHPSWHALLELGVSHQHHSLPWAEQRPRTHVARAAFNMLRHQVDEGASCPLTMTFAAIPTLRVQRELLDEWEPRILSDTYDPRFLPAEQKAGCLFGMALTERQGGSDVRSNQTFAEPLGTRGPGREYALTGQKWFCSAPMSDAFLVLAQTGNGLSCFLAPRFNADGKRNVFLFQRLKDKMGNRSNASSEVEFRGTLAQLVGEEGRGVPVIMEMVRHTRLDCAFGSAATMRRAVAEATHHAAHRSAFGKRLIDQPLMQNVLADLCLESEAATALALRLARGFDESPADEAQARFTRVATAVGKFWVTKRAVTVTAEALECLGGNGYIEESPMPRLYRDAPLNSIWEGSGNVQCLDVLRALRSDADTTEAFIEELRRATGGNSVFDKFLGDLETELAAGLPEEGSARRLAESLALALQASLLVQHSPSFVADAFCASRLAEKSGRSIGTLQENQDFDPIIRRARPRID
jgi:putative acyl-CoA dehydrogenase